MKTPFAALFVREPRLNGFSDSCGVSAVTVLTIDAANRRAEVLERAGATSRRFWTSFDFLATTPVLAAAKLAPFLSAIHGRAPIQKMAVTTPVDGGKPSA
jgi:hypothetical protein